MKKFTYEMLQEYREGMMLINNGKVSNDYVSWKEVEYAADFRRKHNLYTDKVITDFRLNSKLDKYDKDILLTLTCNWVWSLIN